jgi:hypothetical protein
MFTRILPNQVYTKRPQTLWTTVVESLDPTLLMLSQVGCWQPVSLTIGIMVTKLK